MQGEDGKITMSKFFDVHRGVTQGDVMSPVLFTLALDQLVQDLDTDGQGVKVGKTLELRVLGYADDATMIEMDVKAMTKRLTKFTNGSRSRADMLVKLSKTYTQQALRQDKVSAVTLQEIQSKELTHKFPCFFCDAGCTARFKTE